MRASHFRAKLGCFLCFPPVMPLQDPRLGCWGGLVRGNQVSVGLVLYVWDEGGIDETEDWCLGYVMFVDGVCCSFPWIGAGACVPGIYVWFGLDRSDDLSV